VDEEMMRRLEQQQQMERNKEELVSVKSNAQEVNRKLEAQRQRMRDIEQELTNAKSYLNNCVNHASESKQVVAISKMLYCLISAGECSQDIERTKREASSLPSAYGPRMAAFKAEIDKAASKGVFKQKPIGPIGLEVLNLAFFFVINILLYHGYR
jgi:3-methyladenine DNA glycosylase Tag